MFCVTCGPMSARRTSSASLSSIDVTAELSLGSAVTENGVAAYRVSVALALAIAFSAVRIAWRAVPTESTAVSESVRVAEPAFIFAVATASCWLPCSSWRCAAASCSRAVTTL